ncbi:MAG: hypothetical protein DBX00_06500 [Verrucomicrobia bacterium]|nr:MAG: hypothetical protein DBX00_06500 [Verrucomicrobiota bacterium]RPF88333.1 MAG: hypothetical protein CBB78_008305 [Roseibacillus sp. TMED18]
MAEEDGLGKRSEDAAPDESLQVIRLPVQGAESRDAGEVRRGLSPENAPLDSMMPGSEFTGEGKLKLDSAVEDLGVEWDTSEGAGTGPIPMGWLALIVVLLILLGVWGVATLNNGVGHLRSREAAADTWNERSVLETVSAERWLERLEIRTDAYLRASSVEEKARYVRNRGRVLPLMKDYYLRHPLTAKRVSVIENIRPTEVGKRPFFVVEVAVEGEEELGLLLVEDCGDGELRFDWESEVTYQPVEIASYVENKPTESMAFRAYAQLDSFYSFEFSDQSRYQSFKLTFREDDEFLFGYADRSSVEGRGLLALLEEKEEGLPVLVQLRFSQDTKSVRSVLIEKVLATSWVWSGKERHTDP